MTSPLTLVSTCLSGDELRFRKFLDLVQKYKPVMVYFFAKLNSDIYVSRIVQMGHKVTFSKASGLDLNKDKAVVSGTTVNDTQIHVHFCDCDYDTDILKIPPTHNILFYTPFCSVELYSKLIDTYWTHIENSKAVFYAKDLELVQCQASQSTALSSATKERWVKINKFLYNKRTDCSAAFQSIWMTHVPINLYGPTGGTLDAGRLIDAANPDKVMSEINKVVEDASAPRTSELDALFADFDY